LAPSIDHIGPIAKSAWDIAAALQAIAGFDELDSSTQDVSVPNYIEILSEEKKVDGTTANNFKLGIPSEFFFDVIDSKAMSAFENFISRIQGCNVSTFPVHVKHTDKIFDSWRAIRLGESAAVHEEWIKTRRKDYGENVITMLEKGMEVSAVEYIKAQKMRRELRSALLNAMKDYDALLVPTTIIAAPLLDQNTVNINGNNTEVYQALSRLTTVFDITGLPAMNIPGEFIEEEKSKLPIGVQLVGRPFDEITLLRIAHVYEEYHGISEEMIPPILNE
jgi:aspartyl-tRNA(Asn)/glutamyl-tRNA(Gln) amidotransferase subunit A